MPCSTPFRKPQPARPAFPDLRPGRRPGPLFLRPAKGNPAPPLRGLAAGHATAFENQTYLPKSPILCDASLLKITVELPEADLNAICELTGIRKKGPAIRKLPADSLMLQRRREVSKKFLTGEWTAELEGHDVAKSAEREQARTLAKTWHD